MPQPIHPGKTISFGNLNLSCETASFYKENEEKLKLTPQQYALMEMFFLSPTHILNRSDICESLWAGKDQRRRDLEHLDPKATAFSGGKQ